MSEFSFSAPHNFLGLPPEHSGAEQSRVVVLPVPYELTTSYGAGTKRGPAAILEASRQVEFYDRELGYEPAFEFGIHTTDPLDLPLSSPDAALEAIASAVQSLALPGKLLAVLGGEHGMSIGVARGLRAAYPDGFVTVQLDAHADLRDSYEGTPFSHACAARRICEHGPVVQLGVRSVDVDEVAFIAANPYLVVTFYADDIVLPSSPHLSQLQKLVAGRNVFLTIDIDVFDPSLVPSTGTPEPGGLDWYDVLAIIRTVSRCANIIAFDCVELAPIPGLHAPDFLAAKLVYKTMSLIMDARP